MYFYLYYFKILPSFTFASVNLFAQEKLLILTAKTKHQASFFPKYIFCDLPVCMRLPVCKVYKHIAALIECQIQVGEGWSTPASCASLPVPLRNPLTK